MSLPESPAAKPLKAAKAPATAAKPSAESVADRTARIDRESAEREALNAAQSALGRERRLQKLARLEPAIRPLLAEVAALRVENAQLKAQLAAR